MIKEKVVNGRLCWCDTSVLGDWTEYTLEELTLKIEELESNMNTHKDQEVVYEKAPWWANPNIKPLEITC